MQFGYQTNRVKTSSLNIIWSDPCIRCGRHTVTHIEAPAAKLAAVANHFPTAQLLASIFGPGLLHLQGVQGGVPERVSDIS